MSYLKFDKTLMTNLEEALPREILRTNRSGAYHCTTIVDCNTRKYHGLLVIPVPELDDENHVLLSSLDETVIQHGAEFNLGLHKYQGDNYSPRGHKYIREFECEKVPTTIYRVGGVILKKEKLFVHHENRILIRYTLLDAHSATILRLRPFLAFRSVREYTHENAQASREYQVVSNGIKTCMYPGYPELYMQLNKKNEFHYLPDWYRGIEYPKEQERGYDFNEDLYVPGYFEVEIKKGESIVFSGGVSEIGTRSLKKTFEDEVEERTPRDTFRHCLINAAHQFLNKQENEFYILAEREMPGAEYYGDFLQLENGVGMWALMKKEVEDALADTEETSGLPRKVSLATGEAAYPLIASVAKLCEEKRAGLECNVYAIKNEFFGGKITVSGLVTATDIIKQIGDKDLGDELLIPASMLRSEGDMFLDSITLKELSERLNIKITPVANDGYELTEAIIGTE